MEVLKNEKFPRTIPEELYEAWRRALRKGDSAIIAKELGKSRPTIEKAVIYGNVKSQELTDQITSFFTARLEREIEAAGKLNSLTEKTE